MRAQWEHPGSPSSATDDRGQGRQVHALPQPITLMQFTDNVEGNVGTVDFRVEVPDSRLRVNIALIGLPLDGSTPVDLLGTKGLTLWLRAVEDAIRGGAEVPITNLWGTDAVPGPIPGDIDPATQLPVAVTTLGGWGKEFVTSGNAIVGTVDYPVGIQTGSGLLVLQVRWTPEAIRFPRDEWYEIRSQCNAAIKGNPVLGAE